MKSLLRIRLWVIELRVHQWVKNVLVFVPAFANHSIFSWADFSSSAITFLLFSLTASAIYLLNDILDIKSDQEHHKKRFRPIASGEINIREAIFVSFTFLTFVFLVSFHQSKTLIPVLLAYVLLNIFYSTLLKRIAILDVLILSIMYEFRIIAGGLSSNIQLSTWLISSSGFFFLSMAFTKRYAELSESDKALTPVNAKRGYLKQDLDFLNISGIVSGFSCVVIFILYINEPSTVEMYSRPAYLLLLIPILIYILGKRWLEASRNESVEDPIVNLLTDKSLFFVFPFVLILIYASI